MVSRIEKYLIVDLDGTLISGDSLQETIIEFLKKNIFNALKIPFMLFKGKANFKTKLANEILIEPQNFDFSKEVISLIEEKKNQGYKIILCSGSHQKQLSLVAEKLNYFDYVFGTSEDINLKGIRKIKFIKKYVDLDTFSYVGNSTDDIEIWNESEEAFFINKNIFFKVQNKKIRTRLTNLLSTKTLKEKITSLVKLLRIYQWVKNLLIFVPMFLAANLDYLSFKNAFIAFLSFSFIASSIYIFNDIIDIHKDRFHPRKKKRPITCGEISILQSILISVSLITLSIFISLSFLPLNFSMILIFYIFLNFLYSLYLKKIIYFSLIVLSSFYSLRIIAGGEATNLDISFWLIFFSIFFFLGLSTMKRLGELLQLTKSEIELAQRGFKIRDVNSLKVLSVFSSACGCLLLTFYLFSSQALMIYSNPLYLIFIPFITFGWFLNLFNAATKEGISDDPIVFAIRDRISILSGILVIIFYTLAL